MRLVEHPDISQYSNGKALLGRAVKPQMTPGFTLKKVEISLSEIDYTLYSPAFSADENITPPGDIYYTDPDSPDLVTIVPSTGDVEFFILPEKYKSSSDFFIKQVIDSLQTDIPNIIPELEKLWFFGSSRGSPHIKGV